MIFSENLASFLPIQFYYPHYFIISSSSSLHSRQLNPVPGVAEQNNPASIHPRFSISYPHSYVWVFEGNFTLIVFEEEREEEDEEKKEEGGKDEEEEQGEGSMVAVFLCPFFFFVVVCWLDCEVLIFGSSWIGLDWIENCLDRRLD